MTAPAIFATKCQTCDLWVAPSRIVNFALGNGRICEYCWERHCKALAMFAGSAPVGCQVCLKTWEKLEFGMDRQLHMRLYMKDGVYQMLCGPCGDQFERKIDTFKDTAYGYMKGLKGVK